MGIYQELYTLLHTYIYGGVTMTADMELTCTLISTAGAIFVVALPFLLVWNVCKTISGR